MGKDLKKDIHFKIEMRKELQSWAPDTVGFLRSSIQKKGRIDKRKLLTSLNYKSSINPNGVSMFVISYNLYGMFVDMGVGGGKSLAEIKGNRIAGRLAGKKGKRLSKRQYQWYSKTMYGAISYLGYKMMKLYGFEASNAVKLPSVIEM